MPFNESAAIESFWVARACGNFYPAKWFDRLDFDQAYRIQIGIAARRIEAGERQIGWKVGLTSKAIQQQIGFHEPVFACVFEELPSGHVFESGSLVSACVESELCFRLAHDLSPGFGPGSSPCLRSADLSRFRDR